MQNAPTAHKAGKDEVSPMTKSPSIIETDGFGATEYRKIDKVVMIKGLEIRIKGKKCKQIMASYSMTIDEGLSLTLAVDRQISGKRGRRKLKFKKYTKLVHLIRNHEFQSFFRLT